MKHRYLTLALTVLSASVYMGTSGIALAATSHTTKTSNLSLTGNDVSWPQCSKTLPTGQRFGIVGVNDGLANTTNPCFETELTWANQSLGGTGQDLASLYVNTANPGNLGVADWPTSGTSTKYGTCDGTDTAACAYQYGFNMATLDATTRIGNHQASAYMWWLDVETGNSWESNTANNRADLEGMTDYFTSLGARVGLYSTSSQWQQIAESVPNTSSLYGLSSWLPGASSLSAAKVNCSQAGLTGGIVSVTQYVSHHIDYDYSCI